MRLDAVVVEKFASERGIRYDSASNVNARTITARSQR
jgi:hypothetical protein